MQLQSIPRGFLSLLGIKAGANPNQSAEFVQPVIELEPMYLVDSLDSAFVDLAGATNVGDSATIIVPSGQAWRLVALTWQGSTFSAAPAAPVVGVRIREPRGQASAVVGPVAPFNVAAVGDIAEGGTVFPQPVILPPGSEIFARLLNDLGAITFTLRMTAIFHRLVV